MRAWSATTLLTRHPACDVENMVAREERGGAPKRLAAGTGRCDPQVPVSAQKRFDSGSDRGGDVLDG